LADFTQMSKESLVKRSLYAMDSGWVGLRDRLGQEISVVQ